MNSIESAEVTENVVEDISLRPDEKGRIEDLFQRYEEILAQADGLNLQIESLLKDWNTRREQPPCDDA